MKKLIFFLLLPLLAGCTVTTNLTHTDGVATDVVDSNPTLETDADATANVSPK